MTFDTTTIPAATRLELATELLSKWRNTAYYIGLEICVHQAQVEPASTLQALERRRDDAVLAVKTLEIEIAGLERG